MKQRQIRINQKRNNILNVELDIKCSCSPSTLNNGALIQFTRRYLQCQSSMPIRNLRLFIETVLPHSSKVKVSMFDSNDRLLTDSDRLRSLKHIRSSSNHIPIRFTLINTVTSFANCSCLSPLIECDSSSTPLIIQQDAIDQILSTCAVTQPSSASSPCLSISSPSPPNRSCASIGVINLLTPPLLRIDSDLDEATMDRITSQFGEICPSPAESIRSENIQEYSFDLPLDLSMKKRSLTSLDSLSSQAKWIKT